MQNESRNGNLVIRANVAENKIPFWAGGIDRVQTKIIDKGAGRTIHRLVILRLLDTCLPGCQPDNHSARESCRQSHGKNEINSYIIFESVGIQ